jgi:hypothetical protein
MCICTGRPEGVSCVRRLDIGILSIKRFQTIFALALWSILIGMCGGLFAQQSYFNEWYQPQFQYIKLKVPEDGLYRVSKSYLRTQGAHDLQSLTSSNIQVFYRGVEVPIFTKDSASGGLDYFEFVGRRNDGVLDSLLYRSTEIPFGNDPSQQPNLFTSFFTDTSAYFVTWDGIGNERLQSIQPQNYQAYTPEPWYRYRILKEFANDHFVGGGGSDDVWNVLNPDWVTGEGMVGSPYETGAHPDDMSRKLYGWGYANSGNPNSLKVRVIGTNNTTHVTGVDINFTEVFRDTTSNINVSTKACDFNIPLADSFFIRLHAFGQGTVKDEQRVSWATIEYDRTFDLNDSTTTTIRHWLETDTTYLRFYNADMDTAAWLYDLTRKERIQGTIVGGDTIQFLVPGWPGERELFVFTDRALQTPLMDPIPNFAALSADSVGAEFVIITHLKFANSAAEYAQYRSTDTLNPMISKVVYIDEIYNEFGYGAMTSWAIKNFCRYALENWPTKPKHFLLWGKGRNCPKCDNRENYIPTFGTPANDLEYVTNLSRDTVDLVPKAGMGRVSIMDDAQGLVYLDKVMAYEHMGFQPWVKNALFMGGGATSGQQNQISFYLTNPDDGFKKYWEDEPLNGKVWSFQKRSNGMETNSEKTTEQHINEGVGLLQYFGHSAVNIFELDILEPNRYQNLHKYPLMLSFGCSGGNYYEHQASYGERFILEPKKGGIGYLGNTTSGFINQLGQYGQHFYPALLQASYGQTLGEVFQSALGTFCTDQGLSVWQNIYAANHAKQMNLQGDPAIVLHLPTKSELRVTEADVYFPDGFPGALDPAFDMSVIFHNDGRSFQDSFNVVVTHRLPSNFIAWMDTFRVAAFANADTLEITVPNSHGLASAGYNTFEVRLDPQNAIPEYEEDSSNFAEVQQLFLGNIATPIVPPEYAIVSDPTIALISSPYQMRPSGAIHYSFEIDTVSTFNSPFKRSSPVITGSSAIGEWPIPFAMTPGQIYYWRSRLTDTYPEQWISSSFKYVPGRTGWSQSDSPQLAKDAMDGVKLNPASRMWEFDVWTSQLHAYILSFGFPGKAAYFLGNRGSLGDAGPGVLYTPIDEKSLTPKIQGTPYGDWRYVGAPTQSDPNRVQDVVATIASMEHGDYFLLVSSQDPNMPDWPDHVLQAFEMVGGRFTDLRAIPDGNRIIFFGRKGSAPGTAILIDKPNLEITGQPPMHDLDKPLSAPTGAGTIQSTVIGPTTRWSDFTFDWRSLDPMQGDSSSIAVYGIRKNEQEELLFTNWNAATRSLNDINADTFPRIRLVNHVKDVTTYTAPQLESWEVYFDPVADLAFDANMGLVMPDSIEEGELAHLRFMVRNLTSQRMDSVLVKYTLQASDRSMVNLGSRRYGPFDAREIREMSHTFPTNGIGLEDGRYTLIVEVNPDQDQPENNHFNNFYYHTLWINTDEIGPLVDVTVDGKHLMGGDIVSPEPEIVIQINDENAYLPVAVSDSTYRIWFGTERSYKINPMVTIENNDSIEVVPVRMPENKSRLIFKPGRLTDGEYTLAVQGFDAKGNTAAGKPYIIQMNVVTQKSLGEVLPYPNPFSTACHFVYTLTGDEKPSRFDVEIYTISGKLVKVIDLLSMGEVHFGYNVTQYAWDGRDEFGDELANGVYLYRVNARFEDPSQIHERDEGLSTYFKNGFGKMYLMR